MTTPPASTPEAWEAAAIEATQRRNEWVWQAHMARVYRDLLVRWQPEGTAVAALKTDLFEEAIGSHGLLVPVAGFAERVFGIDWAPAIVRAAVRSTQRGTAYLLTADVRALPFAAGTFQLVLSNSSLDHFDRREDIFSALAELGRTISSGGVLILSLDSPHNPAVRLRNVLPYRWLRRFGIVPYIMGATLTRRKARDALDLAGFTVTDETAIVHAPRLPAIWLARWVAGRSRPATWLARLLAVCERAATWPTRYRTGYYIALRAVRR